MREEDRFLTKTSKKRRKFLRKEIKALWFLLERNSNLIYSASKRAPEFEKTKTDKTWLLIAWQKAEYLKSENSTARVIRLNRNE